MTRYSTNLTLLLVNIFLIYVSGHSEVGNLTYFLLPNQNIASSKVSMNYLEQTINYINHYSNQLYYHVIRNSRHSLRIDVFPTCQLVNKLTQLNKKRNSGHVHTNPDKYLLLAEFSVRTVNYGPSFFPSIYGPSATRAGHKSMEKNEDP